MMQVSSATGDTDSLLRLIRDCIRLAKRTDEPVTILSARGLFYCCEFNTMHAALPSHIATVNTDGTVTFTVPE